MEQSLKKFLEFNGKTIFFKNVDGVWWIAIKPICDSLGLVYKAQHRAIMDDEIYSALSTVQGIVGPSGLLRNMTCLPERYIYGWIMNIKLSNTMNAKTRSSLVSYKLKCHDLLYDYFHGSTTDRTSELKTKTKTQIEREQILARIAESEDGQRLKEVEAEIRAASKALYKLDKELVAAQLPLWMSETNQPTTKN